MDFDVQKILEFFRITRQAYIESPFKEMEEIHTATLDVLTEIRNCSHKCEDIIYTNRNKLKPRVVRLIKKFKGKYYSRGELRMQFANASIYYLNLVDSVFALSQEPDSELMHNSFLTLLDNRDYFTVYSEISFLEKIRQLSVYLYRQIDLAWEFVCESEILIDNAIV